MERRITQVDECYDDPVTAALYDAECPWHPQDDFYQALDMAASSVLDVGCGTGQRLAATRERGHTGVLVGVDPAQAMLDVARRKCDRVTWLRGDAQGLDVGRHFDLVTMTGHAFQVLLDDEAVRAALAAFRRHLVDGGLVAFETRNPAARAWEGWVMAESRQVVAGPDGAEYEVWVDRPVTHGFDLVTFEAGRRRVDTGEVHSSRSTLRFVDPDRLRTLVQEAGFRVEGWWGDWQRGPVTPTSIEVIVEARAV